MPRTIFNLRPAIRIVLLLAAVHTATLVRAQSTQPKFVVLLDPAHGGKDPGALSPATHFVEKDVTLDFAKVLRVTLAARNLEVRLTRDDDTTVTPAQRAAAAVSQSASACVTLHATAVGSGVHVFYPMTQFQLPFKSFFDLWFPGYVAPSTQSIHLARSVTSAFNQSPSQPRLKAILAPAADATMSRERCAAVVIELAPLPGDASLPASDAHYQQQAANAIADALEKFRDRRRAMDAGASAYARKAVGR